MCEREKNASNTFSFVSFFFTVVKSMGKAYGECKNIYEFQYITEEYGENMELKMTTTIAQKCLEIAS